MRILVLRGVSQAASYIPVHEPHQRSNPSALVSFGRCPLPPPRSGRKSLSRISWIIL